MRSSKLIFFGPVINLFNAMALSPFTFLCALSLSQWNTEVLAAPKPVVEHTDRNVPLRSVLYDVHTAQKQTKECHKIAGVS